MGRWLVIALVAALSGILVSTLFDSPVHSQINPAPVKLAQVELAQVELTAGGQTTVRNRSSHAYSQPAPNLTEDWLEQHLVGDRAFESVFVTPPANVNPGLGPLFNNASCIGCHIKDGRGMPEKGQLLVRVSLPRQTGDDRTSEQTENLVLQEHFHPEAGVTLGNAPAVPGVGTQIQEQSVYGYAPEATVQLQWSEQSGRYGDGMVYSLRAPVVKITRLDGQALPAATLTSPRIPPPVFGLGLLEAIPAATISQLADSDDRNRDGISGRPNQVWDVVRQQEVLGRFGWKANNPDLLQQSASAYVNDMGVTNPLFPEPNGSSEIDAETLKAATIYVQTLGVPARTLTNDPDVQLGERLFTTANCNACHIPTLSTGPHEISALANQTIHPYTDLLLHDMGAGLADHRPDFQATGNEWRTPPLWGLGLAQTVLPYSGFLHDGRARTLAEAILWHDGEAAAAKETFRTLPKPERDALIRFLKSL